MRGSFKVTINTQNAQNLIHSQFPNIDCLQSCCYAQKPCFGPTTDTFIQILNTHPKGGGLHWVTVSTYAVSLAFGKEPAYLHFENSKMRSHVLNCLHSGVLTEFPCKPKRRKSLYVQAHTVPLYCTCRMSESDLMFQCTKCQRWFHPNCQEIKMNARQLKTSKTVKCLECRSK